MLRTFILVLQSACESPASQMHLLNELTLWPFRTAVIRDYKEAHSGLFSLCKKVMYSILFRNLCLGADAGCVKLLYLKESIKQNS